MIWWDLVWAWVALGLESRGICDCAIGELLVVVWNGTTLGWKEDGKTVGEMKCVMRKYTIWRRILEDLGHIIVHWRIVEIKNECMTRVVENVDKWIMCEMCVSYRYSTGNSAVLVIVLEQKGVMRRWGCVRSFCWGDTAGIGTEPP